MSDNTLLTIIAVGVVVLALALWGVGRNLNRIASEIVDIRGRMTGVGHALGRIADAAETFRQRYELLTDTQSKPIGAARRAEVIRERRAGLEADVARFRKGEIRFLGSERVPNGPEDPPEVLEAWITAYRANMLRLIGALEEQEP